MMTLRWGVLGVGRAGRARVDAIRNDPRSTVVGGWRGDPAAADLESFSSYEDMLQRVDAVAICSPDHIHADQVHTALTARRHVICEFPLASSAREAATLFALAISRDRVLHVEHIELLLPAAAWIRQFVSGREFMGGALQYTGGARPHATSPAHANIARLQRILDAVGKPDHFRLERCKIDHIAGVFVYGERELAIDCRMEEGLPRHTDLVLEFKGGIVRQTDQAVFLDGETISLPEVPGLFHQDQLEATSAILDGVESYCNMERVIDGLALADLMMETA